MKITLALLALLALGLPSPAPSPSQGAVHDPGRGPRPMDAAVGIGGALFVLEATGPDDLELRVLHEGKESRYPLDLDLSEESRVVDVAVAPWFHQQGTHQVSAGLVLEHGEQHTYHFFNGYEDGPVLFGPIFSSRGKPFRLVEMHMSGASSDAFELTLRRGRPRTMGPLGDFEERVFVHDCAVAGLLGCALIDTRAGERLELGTED